MEIQRELPAHRESVRRINEAAFGRLGESDLVDALRARGAASLSLVAVDAGEVVGHILFSPVAVEGLETLRALGLGPMSVEPSRQRGGIGSMLVTSGLEECRRAGWEVIVVLGHAAYYPRFGFVPASRFGLKCKYAVPDDVFMAIELVEGALKRGGSLVSYRPEFDEV